MTALLLILMSLPASGQSRRGVVRSAGVYDFDGTAVYGVYLASRTEVLEDVLVDPEGGAVPGKPGHAGGGEPYEGVQGDVIVWRFPKVAADTILGPINFRVKADGTEDGLPATLQTAASWQGPVPEVVESGSAEGRLRQFATSGLLRLDSRETLDAGGQNGVADVGDSGIRVFVPAGAVSGPAVLEFERVPTDQIEKKDGLWWCYGIKVTECCASGFRGIVL